MNLEEVMQSLRGYIRERYNIPADDADFNDDVHLFDYGYVDSFGAVDLINFVEKEFGITVSQSDLVGYPMNTISEIATFVQLRRREMSNADARR